MILSLLLTTLAAAASAPYGGTFAANCRAYEAKPTVAQKQLLARAASERNYRMRHLLWYALPSTWPGLSDEQRAFFRELVPAWVPPPKTGGGADFFAFHLQLLGNLFARFHEKGAPCLEPWAKIPAGGDWPKMPGGFNASTNVKLNRALARLLDPEWLKSKSLDETGNELRDQLFHPLLAAYTPPDPGTFAGCGLDLEHIGAATGNPGAEYSKHCEDPKNDWLGSAFSAPANLFSYEASAVVVEVLAAWESAHGAKADLAREIGRPAWSPPENFERDVQARLSLLVEHRSKADAAKNLPADPALERQHLKEKLRGIVMSLSLYRWK
jgi:hypothetical protein